MPRTTKSKIASKKVNPKKTVIKQKTVSKKKVKPIPKGYRAVTPYLIVHQAADAIKFYKKAFQAKEIMRFEDKSTKVVHHAELMIGDSMIMLAQECPETKCSGPQTLGGTTVMIHLYVEKVDAVVKKAIAAGAMVLRPVTDQFYGDRSGCVVDPFGHLWNISTHIENVTPLEIKRRIAAMKKLSATQNDM